VVYNLTYNERGEKLPVSILAKRGWRREVIIFSPQMGIGFQIVSMEKIWYE